MMVKRAFTTILNVLALTTLVACGSSGGDNNSPPAPGFSQMKSFAGTEPTMPNRVNRNGTPSDCVGGKTFPGTFAATVPYQVFNYQNVGVSQCVTVTLDSGTCGFGIFITAYTQPFDPTNVATNYLGDAGVSVAAATSTSFSFMAPANSTVSLMVSGVTSGVALTCDYTVSSMELTAKIISPPAGLSATDPQ